MHTLVYKISSLLEKERAITAGSGTVARRFHKLFLMRESFKEAEEELEAALAQLSEEGVATLQKDQSGRITGVFWVNEDGRPNFAWLKTQPTELRAKYVHQWLMATADSCGINMSTGLLQAPLNKTLVGALELYRFTDRYRPLATKLIRDLRNAGLVYDLGGRYCIAISEETRVAALRQVCQELGQKMDRQVTALVGTQGSLFRLKFELQQLENT